MFHKFKDVIPSHDYCLSVRMYIFKPVSVFQLGKYRYFIKQRFNIVNFSTPFRKPNVGGHGIAWNDRIDLLCEELWDNGILEV